VRSFQTGERWGPFVPVERSRGLEKKEAESFGTSFLFNPLFAGSGGAGRFHRLVLAAVRGRRGVQGLCSRCSKSCKVVRASSGLSSSFFCFDAEIEK